MDCFYQTNKEKSSLYHFKKTKEKDHSWEMDEITETKVSHVSPLATLCWAFLPTVIQTMQSRETADHHADPTQAGDEHSTQKVQSTWMIDSKWRQK